MVKKILIGVGALAALLAIAAGGLFFKASSTLNSPVEAPLPPIAAATDAQSIERGRHIFMNVCANCHMQDSQGRVAGGQMKDLPEVFGPIYSANLTTHPTAGIASMKDEEIARAVRYGVRRDGRRIVIMPVLGMSDEDLAAVIGFMRSGDPVFAADERAQPHPRLSLVGTLALGMSFAPVASHPASGLKAPPKGPTPEYGRYLAFEVYGCAECHSPGVAQDRHHKPEAFSGGFEFPTPAGTIFSTNITFHESGLGKWNLAQFTRALRDGVNPEGYVLRDPMIRVRGLDDADAEAMYRFLQTLPKLAAQPLPESAAPRAKASAQAAPEQLFAQLGCVSCHAEGAKFRAMLKRSVSKPTVEVAQWIRNPEAVVPGTQMPTYAELIDESQSMSLAAWVQQQAVHIP
ncbi:cytochrome c [Hyalangium rubrum]|uniref:Cytochrome c n=1 Tax=Hyalangium rubrum TaxID=3103134 RepID=A0ABU5H830_9BACT|nr:cytochrome c [Hyalangium sp. s54d21]MDY7229628.1 cytochrome c [Hyalangium sp. s54d21]